MSNFTGADIVFGNDPFGRPKKVLTLDASLGINMCSRGTGQEDPSHPPPPSRAAPTTALLQTQEEEESIHTTSRLASDMLAESPKLPLQHHCRSPEFIPAI